MTTSRWRSLAAAAAAAAGRWKDRREPKPAARGDEDALKLTPYEAAQRIQALYLRELARALRTKGRRGMSVPQIEAMIAWGDHARAGVHEQADEATWIWSDLHLGQQWAIAGFSRPFWTAPEMDEAIFGAWHRTVGSGDTILCLGDAGIDTDRGVGQQYRWRNAPGARQIVLGNHDVDPEDDTRRISEGGSLLTLVAPGDPPLLLTHVPLLEVPAGTVNVHGHEHHDPSPTTDRHINVCVEQLDYRPARLSDIRLLARRMLDETGVPDHTTAVRIEMARRLTAQAGRDSPWPTLRR